MRTTTFAIATVDENGQSILLVLLPTKTSGVDGQKTHGDQGDDAQTDPQSYSKMFLIKSLNIV